MLYLRLLIFLKIASKIYTEQRMTAVAVGKRERSIEVAMEKERGAQWDYHSVSV